jgi:hypothetical protein
MLSRQADGCPSLRVNFHIVLRPETRSIEMLTLEILN